MTKRRLTVRTYDVVADAVERGVAYGVRRAWKHEAVAPSDERLDAIAEHVRSAVLTELCEVVNFDS